MEFPLELRNAVEHFAAGMKPEQMKQISKNLSNRYRKESGAGKKLLTEDMEAVVYAIVRMPATFGAVYSALVYAIETSEFEASSLLDVGAGTGAVSWAAQILLNLDTITCLERENAMQNLGKALMQEGSEALRNARWISADLVSGDIVETADLVTASYVLGELSPENRVRVLDRLWQATEGMLLIVEPGTPEGYRQLQTAREYLLAKGAHLAAPCPHERPCPMKQDDWCHFTCRVSRSRLHRMLKEGDVPYEDEKFCYMAFTRFETEKASARILRHPYVGKGQISLDLCSKAGIGKTVIRKKEGSLFKEARKAACGDSIEVDCSETGYGSIKS